MIKFWISFSLIFLSLSAFGQIKSTPQKSSPNDSISKERKVASKTPVATAKEKSKKMKLSLNLNDKQEAGIYNVFLKYETGMEKVKKSKLPIKEKSLKVKALSSDKQKQLEQILTKEQYKAYIMSFP